MKKWFLKPSYHERDILYNRRLLAYYSLLFSAVWSVCIFAAWLLLAYRNGQEIGATDLGVLFGVPGLIAGLNVWKYLEAAKIDQIATPPASELSETVKSEVLND